MAKVKMTAPPICSICQLPYEEFGNNAEPINDGRCCNFCNNTVVVPVRLRRFQVLREEQRKEKNNR